MVAGNCGAISIILSGDKSNMMVGMKDAVITSPNQSIKVLDSCRKSINTEIFLRGIFSPQNVHQYFVIMCVGASICFGRYRSMEMIHNSFGILGIELS